MTKRYTLLRERFEHEVGITVYQYSGVTYGLVSDDNRYFGIEHTAVTLDPEGSIPFFTVPIKDIEEQPDDG